MKNLDHIMNCPYNFITQFDDWWYWHVCVIYWKTGERWANIVAANKDGWNPVVNPSSGGLVKRENNEF